MKIMKVKRMMAIAGASLFLGTTVFAQPRDGLRTQAYEYGWDAAQEFCVDLRPPFLRTIERGSMTRTFSRWCKRGFDEHIDDNWACKRRIREQGAYTLMWETRRDTGANQCAPAFSDGGTVWPYESRALSPRKAIFMKAPM